MTIVGGIYGGSGDGLTPAQQQQLIDAYNLSLQNETDLTNADNLTTGEVDDSLLSSNVTLKGNTVNQPNALVELDGNGNLPAVNASQVTDISANNIATGTVDTSLLDTDVTTEGNTFNGADNLVKLDGNGHMPAVNAGQVTDINADNISSGTLDNNRLNSDVVVLDSNSKIPAYDGSQVTGLTQSQVGLGNVDNTSDANKPVSTATQTALDAKANKLTSFTSGNVVTVDANGHPQDSGETIANLKDGWQGTVATFADLPTASSSNNGHVYKVTTATGVIGINKKYAGSYISNGTSWVLFGYKQASVINQPLSGFTLPTTASAVTSSDSILSAAQKIQKQLNDNTYIDSLSFDSTTRDLTVTLNDASTITVNIPGGGDLVNDTSPQLGGGLDLNSNNVTGTGNISITGDVTASRFNGNLSGQTLLMCKSGQALTGGDPVHISGYDSTQGKPIVSLAQSGVYQLPYGIQQMPCVGLASASVSNGSSVSIVISGELTGIDTSSFNVGDTLYVADYQDSTTLTDTPPTDATSSAYSLIQTVGIVSKSATSGTILVQINKPNQLPNLDYNKVIIGGSNNQPEERQLNRNDVGLSNATTQGNTFNGADQLIKADSSGRFPGLDGSLITNLSSSSDFIYSDTFSGASDTTVVNDSYIQIRYHSSSKQFQYFPKASASWGWVDGGFIYSRGSNHTVKGDSGNIKNATNQSWTYIGFSGVYDAQYNLNNYGTQIIAFLVKDTYSSSHPAYIIHAGCGSNTSIFCSVRRVGP